MCETLAHCDIPAMRTLLAVLAVSALGGSAYSDPITVFHRDGIHFSTSESGKYVTGDTRAEDNGRVIARTLTLPAPDSSTRIIAHLVINPIPKDEIEVHDRWDRAGDVRVSIPGKPDLELIKFITAYGGRTEYDVDVTHLSPVLQGETTIKAFIDTWVSPAWTVDLELVYSADSLERRSSWVTPVLFEQSYTREAPGDTGFLVQVDVPSGQKRVILHYYVSGHCTDGMDADEFVKKDNVISVDGVVVYRYQPWRDDCRRFREINPYTRRWSDGYWSSDYSRSGWCPGDFVRPLALDLTDHLTPGQHTIRFAIENVRPKNEKGDHGYWRVSAAIMGVDD